MTFSLTDEQNKVVQHNSAEHGRVLAGPGTGKSATAVALAEKIYLENPDAKIKFLTFTRAATSELDKKLSDSPAGSMGRPSTVHSFSISNLLRNPGCASFPQPLRIPDKHEYKMLIRPHLAAKSGFGLRQLDKLVAEMSSKWESLDPHENAAITVTERARFMGVWHEHRRLFGYTLIQELPDLFRCALRDHEDLEGIYYELLIVDEYQDLNACDLELLRRLADRGVSVLAIGDDDQSIYSFRKAHPEGIRRFLKEYGSDNDYKLTVCHRSPLNITDWAQYVIMGDPDREPRDPPACKVESQSAQIALLKFRGNQSEALGVADLVKWLNDTKGVPTSEILILTRTDRAGTFTKKIKEKLIEADIPVSDPSAIEALLDDSLNRRLLEMLRLLVDQYDSIAWLSLIKIQSGLGEVFIEYIYSKAKSEGKTFGEAFVEAARDNFVGAPSVSVARALGLWQEIEANISNIDLSKIDGEIWWGDWIIRQIVENKLPPCSEELRNLLLKLDEVSEDEQDLGRFLSQTEPLGKDLMIAESEGVRFMTMAGSKGLTVQATIIVGVDNDLIPKPDQDLAEERRLLYVAMTRSQDYLFLTWANQRRGPAARSGRVNTGRRQPSDFLRGGPVESQDGQIYITGLQ